MSEPTQKEPRQTRVPIGALINVDQREQVVALARKEDRSVSAVVRRALAAELDRHEARAS
jgi:post-segregation antitoxin (ccd killing protein)